MAKEEFIIAIVSVSILMLLFVIFILIFIKYIIQKKGQHKLEKQKIVHDFQQAILQTQIEIQEQTLKNISQEIHDNIGQVLSLAKLNLNTLLPEETEKLNDTKQLVSKAINDLRDLSRSLHGDRIAELGLQESIANELKILQNTGQFQTDLIVRGNFYKLDKQKEMVIFRIAQEAINNALKHAKAKRIEISINYQPGFFELSIADNGTGFDIEAVQHDKVGIGLRSMQNRAALIGASWNLQSAVGNGTTINVKVRLIN